MLSLARSWFISYVTHTLNLLRPSDSVTIAACGMEWMQTKKNQGTHMQLPSIYSVHHGLHYPHVSMSNDEVRLSEVLNQPNSVYPDPSNIFLNNVIRRNLRRVYDAAVDHPHGRDHGQGSWEQPGGVWNFRHWNPGMPMGTGLGAKGCCKEILHRRWHVFTSWIAHLFWGTFQEFNAKRNHRSIHDVIEETGQPKSSPWFAGLCMALPLWSAVVAA